MSENIEQFITTIAWVGGIVALVCIIMCIIASMKYLGNPIRQIEDSVSGITRTFPAGKFWILGVICWAWLFVRHVL